MGYFENVCHLCWVSLSIARIRTATEPESAAWCYYGESFVENDRSDDSEIICAPTSESGCSTLTREGSNDKEHIAGPGCRRTNGYAGSRISLEEMKGCRAVRCIVPKTEEFKNDWEDEEDDEPWERSSFYFFTGVGDGSPDEAPMDEFDRVRHGADSVVMTNDPEIEDGLPYGLPVHPTCWEIFKRVSVRQCGFVDVHGLWRYATIGARFNTRYNIPRHVEVLTAAEQWWEHNPGSEWLAANPVDIPGFMGMVRTFTSSYAYMGGDLALSEPLPWQEENTPRYTRNPDDWTKSRATIEAKLTVNDPLSKLPLELRLAIVELLPSRDLATARLVFRCIKALPTFTFRQRLIDDMPWLWEIQDLKPDKTNWFRLYQASRTQLMGLKGYKNRVRIWKDVELILKKIQSARASGQINGITGWEDNAQEDLSDKSSQSELERITGTSAPRKSLEPSVDTSATT